MGLLAERREHGCALNRRAASRYPTEMKTTLSKDGKVTIPRQLREQDQLRARQRLEWLLSCPDKDWFRPLSAD